MRKFIYFISIALLPNLTEAHSSNISTVALIKCKDNNWTVHISASLSAFQYALISDNGSLQLDNMSSGFFQQKLIDLIRKKLSIELSGDHDIKLEDGIVKLGHETEVVFKLIGKINNPEKIMIRNDCFLSIPDHYCILKVITPEGASSNIILEKNNEYSVKLLDTKAGYDLTNSSMFNWKLGLFGVVILFAVFLFMKKINNLFCFE